MPKSALDFSPSKKHRNGLFPWCLLCKSTYQAAYVNGLPKAVRTARYTAWKTAQRANKEARARFLGASAAYSIKRRYGLTTHQVVQLAAVQGEVCAICGSVPDMTQKHGALHVDHDHATGLVRGLLCRSCNAGLAFFKDDPQRLMAAIGYLKHPPAGQVSYMEPIPRPKLGARQRNPEKRIVLRLVCKQCGGPILRAAAAEFHSRSKGKEGPFCNRKCAGVWAQSRQAVVGLVHGTTNGYTYHRCRCDECKTAHTQAEKRRRETARSR